MSVHKARRRQSRAEPQCRDCVGYHSKAAILPARKGFWDREALGTPVLCWAFCQTLRVFKKKKKKKTFLSRSSRGGAVQGDFSVDKTLEIWEQRWGGHSGQRAHCVARCAAINTAGRGKGSVASMAGVA